MRKAAEIFKVETVLFIRGFFGFFFTFVFPSLMLLLYGSIYGNEPSAYFGGQGAMDASVPAYSAMMIGVTGLMAFPLTLSSYKEGKIYKRFDATPAGKGLVVAMQALVNLVMTAAGFALLFVVGRIVYQVRFAGHWFAMTMALLMSISAIFSLGFLFTAVAPTAKITNLLCYVAYFTMLFLSGSTIPMALLPATVAKFSDFLPLTHVVRVLQGTFRGASFGEYQASVAILALLTAACAIAGAMLYKKKSWS